MTFCATDKSAPEGNILQPVDRPKLFPVQQKMGSVSVVKTPGEEQEKTLMGGATCLGLK